MISLVAQCGKCGVRWATGAVRDVQGLGFAVSLLSKSLEAGAPICINCSGGTASDVEVKQHARAVELAKGTNLPECPFCEAVGRDLLEIEQVGTPEANEETVELECCEEGAEVGWWGPPTGGGPFLDGDLRWHRKSLEERPS